MRLFCIKIVCQLHFCINKSSLPKIRKYFIICVWNPCVRFFRWRLIEANTNSRCASQDTQLRNKTKQSKKTQSQQLSSNFVMLEYECRFGCFFFLNIFFHSFLFLMFGENKKKILNSLSVFVLAFYFCLLVLKLTWSTRLPNA